MCRHWSWQQPTIRSFLEKLEQSPPPAAVIENLAWAEIDPEDLGEFVISPSIETSGRAVSIPPDLAICPDCETDIRTPGNRRFGYAFTNCTNCGPRFTISRDIPYDRPATTMAPFVMCPSCQAEYEDVEDRRFHAQPNACPECGPRLEALDPLGAPLAGDPIQLAADTINRKVFITDYSLGYIYSFSAEGKDPVRILDASVPGQEIVDYPEGIFCWDMQSVSNRTGGLPVQSGLVFKKIGLYNFFTLFYGPGLKAFIFHGIDSGCR